MTKRENLMTGLVIGALGVVFGDIGTSPLYAIQAVFGPLGLHLDISQTNVYGIISLILWSVTLVVSIKFIGFIMRADNEGEGGIMALVALIKGGSLSKRYKWLFIFMGLVGVALFYGDSVITPAISVLSAVEGLKVVAPHLDSLVIPITIVILSFLFLLQKKGTGVIGRLFGPVMLVWFTTIGAGGMWQIYQHPGILQALSPLTAVDFFVSQPLIAFLSLTAVVLSITGAEALYADMGHFGRPPITRAWFFVVFPALLLCYMGQGALLLHNSETASNPLVLLFPQFLHIPIILLATFATLIASQSVISGAFSLTRQASRLDFVPKMLVRHTSIRETGQIYIPFINAVIFILVIVLVVMFGSSQKLVGAFGIAVSGTLAIDTLLFAVAMYAAKRKAMISVVIALCIFLPIDLLFFTANLPKLFSGGWFPIALAAIALLLITTWTKGQRIIIKERRAKEGSLQTFIDKLRAKQPPILRLPGQAVYISHNPHFAPLALHAAVNDLNELHEKVVVVSVKISPLAHIPTDQRVTFDNLKYDDGISHVSLLYGFHDSLNIPKVLEASRHLSPELDFDPYTASYFVSMSKIIPGQHHNMARWRKSLYLMMSRNALSMSDYYKLPVEHTVEMRSLLTL